ncbi:MAG: alkaline phosphatase family protein [Patescibacteria group bacterium]|jgi:predicted AlkP superfamily phosphohydrolase/phosphomutase
MSDQNLKNKVVVIGLDGSSWDLVKPLVEQGKLPNIKKIMNTGVSTVMRSTMPSHSAPAWTTFATGVNPVEHGCLDFLVVRDDIDDLDIIDSTKIKQNTIYEMMVRGGRTPILINLPNTFPPKLKNNITITSLMTRGDKYIYPETLKEKYPELKQYRLSPNPKLRMTDNLEPYINDLCKLEEERIAGVKQLFLHEPWDFFFYLCSGTDWVGHVAYDKALYEHYEPALRMWYIMDEFIGWVIQRMNKDTTLFVMSDHGFKTYQQQFFINRWLEENNYLTTTYGEGSFHQSHSKLSREIAKAQGKRKKIKIGKTIRSLLATSSTLEKLAKWLYFKIIKKFVPISVSMDLRLDLKHTKVAFPRGSMASLLYINDEARFIQGIVKPEEKATLIRGLKQDLIKIKDKHGKQVVKNVYTKEELYGAKGIKTAPDLFIEEGDYYLSGSLHSAALFEKKAKNYHANDGMLLAYGNGITHRDINSTDIINMAPTILQAMQLPLHPQFGGNVMDIFAPNTNFTQSQIVKSTKRSSELDNIINELIL